MPLTAYQIQSAVTIDMHVQRVLYNVLHTPQTVGGDNRVVQGLPSGGGRNGRFTLSVRQKLIAVYTAQLGLR